MFVKEKSLQSKSDTQEINVNAKTKQTKKKPSIFFSIPGTTYGNLIYLPFRIFL